MAIEYAEEKFYTALRALTGAASQRQRLEDAYVYNLVHVRSEALPEPLRHKFQAFCDDLTRVSGKAGEGAVRATIATMTDDQVADMVGRFLALKWELSDHIRLLRTGK